MDTRTISTDKPELIVNYLDDDKSDWSDIIFKIKELCNIEHAEYIAMKIVRDFGYRRKDALVLNPSTEYRLTEDLYEDLNDLCQCEDCKNGVQIYRDTDGQYYFQITGANFYDKEDKYAGTDTVKVWFKEFVWKA